MKRCNPSHFIPLTVTDPHNMKPVEQVFCIVALSVEYSYEELRKRQNEIDFEIEEARRGNAPKHYLQDLFVTRSMHSAAIAYQVMNNDIWTHFVK